MVVDRFSKAAHFISLPKLSSAKETALVVVDHIFRIHGLPKDVVSDRGPQFGISSLVWSVLLRVWHQDLIRRPMGSLNEPTRIWIWCSAVWHHIIPPPGASSSHGQSMPIIHSLWRPLVCPLFKVLLVISLYLLHRNLMPQSPMHRPLSRGAYAHGKEPGSRSFRQGDMPKWQLIVVGLLHPSMFVGRGYGFPLSMQAGTQLHRAIQHCQGLKSGGRIAQAPICLCSCPFCISRVKPVISSPLNPGVSAPASCTSDWRSVHRFAVWCTC